MLEQLQEEFIPTVLVGSYDKPKWMNRAVVMAWIQKKQAWRKYKFCRSDENFEQHKIVWNKLKSTVLRARRNFERKIALQAKSNPKSFWSYRKVRNPDGQLTQTNEEAANCINSYFATVFTDEEPLNSNNCNFPDSTSTGNIMPYIIIKEEDIMMELNSLKVDKAMGPDGISPRVLVEAKEHLVHPLKLIFCKSLNQGELPWTGNVQLLSQSLKRANKICQKITGQLV